jgi:hypothetical protein
VASFSVLPYKKVTLEDMLTKDEADARSALVSSFLFFFLLLCACDHSSPPTRLVCFAFIVRGLVDSTFGIHHRGTALCSAKPKWVSYAHLVTSDNGKGEPAFYSATFLDDPELRAVPWLVDSLLMMPARSASAPRQTVAAHRCLAPCVVPGARLARARSGYSTGQGPHGAQSAVLYGVHHPIRPQEGPETAAEPAVHREAPGYRAGPHSLEAPEVRAPPFTLWNECARWHARQEELGSLLRRLKETVLSWCFEPDPQGLHGMFFSELELATVAMAYIYFESAAHTLCARAPCASARLHWFIFGIFASPALK